MAVPTATQMRSRLLLVIGGPGAFIVVANGFEDFARAIVRKLLRDLVSENR